MNHADKNSILYPLQHGFRSKRSCETQLIEIINEVTTNMSAGKQTDVLVMDFSKAFDKVSHCLLVHKLDHYGICGKTNTWIHNFLSEIPSCSCWRRKIQLYRCRLRSTSGLCTRAIIVPFLHKWHAALSQINCKIICWRHYSLPGSNIRGWCSRSTCTIEPQQTRNMGEKMENGISSR